MRIKTRSMAYLQSKLQQAGNKAANALELHLHNGAKYETEMFHALCDLKIALADLKQAQQLIEQELEDIREVAV